jgi:hypothetical protein
VCGGERNCRFHFYANDLQINTVDGCRDVNRLVALVNGDLQGFWIGRVIIPLFLMLLRLQALLVSFREGFGQRMLVVM